MPDPGLPGKMATKGSNSSFQAKLH